MREYARPSASERGEDATSSERRSHSTLGKQNRQPSWPIVSHTPSANASRKRAGNDTLPLGSSE